MSSDRSHIAEYFLAFVCVLYVVLYFMYPAVTFRAVIQSYSLLIRLIPIFIMVFLLMAGFNYLVTTKDIVKHFSKEHTLRNWSFAILGGILSSGPIYMWYPLLDSLRSKGVSDGLIAAFLYNRAVKPALLPIMIIYFGLPFVAILTLVMVFISVLDGVLVEYLLKKISVGVVE